MSKGRTRKISLTLRELTNDYKRSLIARNRSPKTISWYQDILFRYLAFLESEGLNKPVEQLGRNELDAYIIKLQKSTKWSGNSHVCEDYGKLSPYSIQGHIRAIKAFWGWLCSEEYIEKNKLSRFPLPKVPKYIIRTLSSEQIKKLLSQIDRNTPLGAKYYCIILLLLDTGMRISELIGIKIKDIDVNNGLVKIFGKGRKERIVPFCRLTRKELIRYCNNYRNILNTCNCDHLFLAQDGDHISVNSVQQYIRRLKKKAGFEGIKLSPHIFRHTFATQAIANDANVLTLKNIMGHESLQTTMRYTHLSVPAMKVQHDKFSPVVNLRKTNS